jgi:hypothetical protein
MTCCTHMRNGSVQCSNEAIARFLPGWRCAEHTPARLSGRAEAPTLVRSLAASQREKRVGIDVAIQHAPDDWLTRAKRAIAQLARESRAFTSEDVTQLAGLPSGDVKSNANNAVGALMNAAARKQLIVKTGRRVPSTRVTSHAAELTEWIGA